RLPDLDQRVRYRPAIAFEDATHHVDALANGLSADARVSRQVRISRTDGIGTKHWTGELGDLRIEVQQRLLRRSLDRAGIRLVQIGRMHLPVAAGDCDYTAHRSNSTMRS